MRWAGQDSEVGGAGTVRWAGQGQWDGWGRDSEVGGVGQ